MTRNWQRIATAALVVGLFLLVPRCAQAQPSPNSQSGQTGQATQNGRMDGVGQISGDERFLRENRDPGQLVGGSVQGVGNLRGQTDAGGQATSGMSNDPNARFNAMNQFGGANSAARFNDMNQFGGANSAAMFNAMSRQRQQLRVPLRLGPNGVSSSAAIPAVASGPNLRVQKHLARIPQLKNSGPLAVEMEGRVAVLRGEVSSQHERDLVARLVLLEPGIADVRNELQVAALPPSP